MATDGAFHPLDHPGESLPGVAAVDGTAHVLRGDGIWSVATRTAAARYPGTPSPAPLRVTTVAAGDAHDALRQRYAPHGVEVPAPADAEAFGAALCAVQETEAALDTLRRLPTGGLLLLDGSLRGLPAPAADLVALLERAAGGRGVRVAGVTRRSGLQQGGRPLVPALRVAGIEALPGTAGYTSLPDLPGVHVCLLEPRAARAYRVDADAAALPLLVPLSHDRNHRGYPYPLAAARQAVALDAERLDALREQAG